MESVPTMPYTIHLLLLLSACFSSNLGQYLYDFKTCSSTKINHCDLSQTSCQSYLLYRANPSFRNVSRISSLFGADRDSVLQLNKLVSDYNLELGTEVIVPITCACVSDQYYQGNITYFATGEESSLDIDCVVFQGLVSSTVVFEDVGNRDILVPIECACPGTNRSLSSGTEVKYLLTYRFKSGDDCRKLADKFEVPVADILEINGLDYRSTVFTNTTALVPLSRQPIMSVSLEIPDSPPPDGKKLQDEEISKSDGGARVWRLYVIIGGTSMFFGSLIFIGGFIACAKRKKTQKNEKRQRRTIASPISPCLSPEVLTEVKYYSLIQYSIDELRSATLGFDEGSKIDGGRFHKGKINGVEILIRQMNLEAIGNVIDAHSRINHKNILNLIGVCYKKADTSSSYVVFDYPTNGCLRQLLSRQETGLATISWPQRMQIAFDIATGIHYLHYCIFPSSVRTRISTRNVFVTENWRAKLVNIHNNGGGEQDDIVLFGTMLFEIISGRVVADTVRTAEFGESVAFLSGGGCFEKLKGFVDPRLRDDYPLAEALCLSVLAKACVEDDPGNRPSIDDIIKVLARII